MVAKYRNIKGNPHIDISKGFYLYEWNEYTYYLLVTIVLQLGLWPNFSHRWYYINNCSLQQFSQDYWPSFSHYICCCGGTYKLWRDLQVYSRLRTTDAFEKLFSTILLTLRVFARNLLRESRWRNIFAYFALSEIFGLGLESCL